MGRLVCDGCGCKVLASRPLLEPARRAAAARGHRFYIVCRPCADPFLNLVARGAGVARATSRRMLEEELVDDLVARRRRFLASN